MDLGDAGKRNRKLSTAARDGTIVPQSILQSKSRIGRTGGEIEKGQRLFAATPIKKTARAS